MGKEEEGEGRKREEERRHRLLKVNRDDRHGKDGIGKNIMSSTNVGQR